MSSLSSDSKESGRGLPSQRVNDRWCGALVGLIPLGLLAGVIVLALAITRLIREVVATAGFFVQQQASLITLITGLILAIAVYVVSIWLTLRRVAAWQREGAADRARSTLWTLGVTALVVVLPVVVAIVLPQHPAP